ncbi:uncharacterized protein LOC111685338 [Lucilia cuprina]|uniref:uncharacterized protein LOC111685338 n=1 Tax=Lucilia cuprina TaxID=7375 RepID=UPI001F058D00|nr:uncharacterized protein LOC111685338 [Lucilia cuprina]XP_046812586.1 uncharacterized protein LOC111685338 [Lucilia cuprina]
MSSKSGPQLLTEEECLEIIKYDLKHNDTRNIKLQTYKIKKCSADLVGFMGEYYKLEVEAINKISLETIERSYFLKSLPLDNELYRDECERKGFFTKESEIYRSILPHIQKYTPRPLYPQAYLTRKDLLVLEDFSRPEKRLKQMQSHEIYTLKHYQLYLQHLAELHSASLAWEFKDKINIGQQFEKTLYELQLINTNEWYITGIKAILFLAQQHPKYQYEQALEFINHKLYNILLNMEDFTKPSHTLRNVLCHRDSWDRNIFWELDAHNQPIACRMVDFQLTRYSPPAIDVLYFLYNNFESPQQRSKLLKDLLSYYHQTLREAFKRMALPEDLITEAEFNQDCQRALLPVLTLRAICEPLMKLPNGFSQTMRETEPETFDCYMNSDRTEMFSRVSAIDSTYMDKVLLPVQELLEYFDLQPK